MSRKTPLYARYAQDDGAKLTDFHGWMLPLSFSDGIVAEHRAVRNTAGLFDVSHMGRLIIEGDTAVRYVARLFTNTIPRAGANRCRYGVLCTETGGCVDDVLVYRLGEHRLQMVVNASNRDAVLRWLREENPYAKGGERPPHIEDVSGETAQIAVQGPASERILERYCAEAASVLRNYRFRSHIDIGGVETLVSRTGYTGEDGFELYCAADRAVELWDLIEEAGVEHGLARCGLGARDTLRFEAGMPLYGHEIRRDITPLEAALDGFVRLDKGEFCGRDALLRLRERGLPRRRIGLEMVKPGVPREENPVFADGAECGRVTSGGKCHTEAFFGAMALVASDHMDDTEFEIEIHGRRKPARRRELPFYTRRRAS